MREHSIPWPGVLRRALACCAAVLLACCASWAQAPARPQTLVPTMRRPAFRAVSYDVSASLSPSDQTLSARATVEFESRESSRTVECELHPNLRVSDVLDATGKPVSFERDDFNQLLVRVSLPDAIAAGQRTKLTFVYAGPLANEENSPVRDIRLAWIGNEGAYLLLPARWFPLTEYPSNRYTGVFHIEVPQKFTVAGTGVAEPPTAVATKTAGAPVLGNRNPGGPGASAAPAPRMTYTFRTDRPEAAGTFVAGTLQMLPVKAEGVSVSVYAPPDGSSAAQAYGEAVARMIGVFSDQFGPLAQPNLAVAQIPDGSLASFAAPGLLLVSQRQWTAAPNTRVLSNLVAAQWWGDQVMAASPSDTWLTDGLARYSEALYVEQTASKASMDRALDDFAVGALMYEGAAPIAEAGRLPAYSPDYESVVINKGATVFHMLRGQLGDAAFFSLLRDFFAQFSGKSASLSDFEKMAEARAGEANAGPPAETAEEISTSPSSSGPPVLKHVPAASDAATTPAPVIGNAPRAADAASGSLNLRPFFAQWLNSTGVPEFTLDYTVFRTKRGFKIVGKVKQNLDFFRMPVEVEVQTEGNPEFKSIQVTGKQSDFELDVFGRPKAGGIILDPHNYILKSSERLHVRSIIARGEALAEESRFYDAIQQYSQALDLERNNSLADFRMGEAFFYQKNYSAAANAFRDTLDGNLDPSDKWVEVWSHIYLGKIYDISGDRTRAINEYSKAQQTNDDTGGAQDEAKAYIAKAYTEGSAPIATSSDTTSLTSSTPSSSSGASPRADSGNDRPVLKRKDQ